MPCELTTFGTGEEVRKARARVPFCKPTNGTAPHGRALIAGERRSQVARFARVRALARAWRESARCDAAATPSSSRAPSAARDRVGFGLRPVALGAFFPGGGGMFTPARLALDSPMAITCLAERAPCLPSRTCSISSRTYSPACADGDLAFRAGRGAFFSGMPTFHRCRAVFSLSVFPIWSGAVVPENLRPPGGVGHIGPIAFVETRSVLQFFLVHVQDEGFLVFVHLERTPRHREQLVSHAQHSAEGQYGVGYPAGWDVDHDLVEFAKVFARRVPYAVSSQCARRQDAPILFVRISLLDFALHRNAPYASGALHL